MNTSKLMGFISFTREEKDRDLFLFCSCTAIRIHFIASSSLIPLLTDWWRHGGSAKDAFDVVVPDLPGYGFSDKPDKYGEIFHAGDRLTQLMKALGYQHFGVHGGDFGSSVAEQLAQNHADAVVAIHLTDVPFGHIVQRPRHLTSAEKKFFESVDAWMQKEGAYALIQSTKPQSLAEGLNDSPAGLAAWMLEKYKTWSDCGDDINARYSKDELLTQVMIYWVTQSIGTSFLPYFDYANASAFTWMKEGVKHLIGSQKVPAAFALFPKDISHPPRELAERFFNVQRWAVMPRGGHFAALEEPELLGNDLREWFERFRSRASEEKFETAIEAGLSGSDALRHKKTPRSFA